jgi:hypothetical protein
MMPTLLASYVLFAFVRRKNMPRADARTQHGQYLGMADDQSAAQAFKAEHSPVIWPRLLYRAHLFLPEG